MGQIQSTDDDVTLNSPGAILDADNTPPPAADVIGRNITMTAGDNLDLSDPNRKSGHGGVGTPRNFLEIQVNADGGALGVLTVTDTASARTGWDINNLPSTSAPPVIEHGASTGTYGVFITQVVGDMTVNRILTNGDASLATLAGSIVDARFNGAGDNSQFGPANLEANNVDLKATGGSIGTAPATADDFGNDFKIDSGHGDTATATPITGRLGAMATFGIFLTETLGALNVLLATAAGLGGIVPSYGWGVRLTVREHSGQGDDLNLIHPSDLIHPDQNENAVLFAENAKLDVPFGNVTSTNGWVLLRAGDNVTTGAALSGTDAYVIANNTFITAASWIDVYGDYDAFTQGVSDLDTGATGHGTVMHLHGSITPGTLSASCLDEINPGRDCNVTQIFGNTDTDTFNFDQTFLGGRTHVYGSRAMTCTAHSALGCALADGSPRTAPAGDSEDFAFVNELQTMNVAAGHTLTLDLQDGTDTYVVNTTGSQGCLGANQISGSTCHNYVINVLDTGAPDRGSDVLIVNGVDNTSCSGYADPAGTAQCPTDDIFLLRRSRYIASTPTSATANEVADSPAFVALLHGNFGTPTTVPATTNVNLTLCYHTGGSCAPGQTLTGAPGTFDAVNFTVGRRIHLGGGDAGVWSGDYTVQSRAADGSSITLAETLPTGISLTTEQVPTEDVALHGVTIGVLLGDVTTPDPTGSASLRNQNYERINYDTAINGRLIGQWPGR